MSCIGTWSFALDAVTSAAFEIQTNANVGCIDVLEKAINGNYQYSINLMEVEKVFEICIARFHRVNNWRQ